MSTHGNYFTMTFGPDRPHHPYRMLPRRLFSSEHHATEVIWKVHLPKVHLPRDPDTLS